MDFKVANSNKDSKARAGVLKTDHGSVETPVFMPVGTVGTVKAVFHRDIVEQTGSELILGNTYHLYLRPGVDVLEKAGGLHKFSGWDKILLTDSGGFQVFSLSENRKLTEEGAVFRSHIDGSKHLFTPENVVDIQRSIGADIIMALDECTPGDADYSYAKKSMQLTHRWLKRGVDRFSETDPKYGHSQSFFPIVQGSGFQKLRRESAEFCASMNMEGNAIGGLSVGEPDHVMYDMIEVVNEVLPQTKPRYLMGVGTPINILEAIDRGVDMFDCVMPTRNARNGMLFTSEGIINIKNEKWKYDFSALDENGTTFVDKQYSKAYLRHLVTAGEYLAGQIASLHNLGFYLWLMKQARIRIVEGTFASWKKEMVQKLGRRL